jgi:benzoate membrane transport protein
VLVIAVAGLALLPALATSLANATADPDHREAAIITFVVTAAGLSIAGIGSAFWGLLAGLVALILRRRLRATHDTARTEKAPVGVASSSPQ